MRRSIEMRYCTGMHGFMGMRRCIALGALGVAAMVGIGVSSAAMGSPTAAADDDLYAPWARMLAAHVDDEGLVDYAGLEADRGDLEAFMTAIAAVDPGALASDAERMAFWINAYNAVVISGVVERYPLDSVRDVGALWGLIGGFFKQTYPVAGGEMSPDNIEHDTLRAKFDDERIHWALVCAAFGCPRLLKEPYRAETLDETLARQSHEFLRQPRGLQLDRDEGTLYLSSYFDWYEDDFTAMAADLLEYAARYAADADAAYIDEHRDELRVKIMDYDWTLNDQPNGPRSRRPVPRD